MRPVDEHVGEAVSLVERLTSESVPLEDAYRRVLAEPAVARDDGPPFDNSAMDGYAVRRADATAGATLPLAADIAAGSGLPDALAHGHAARIMTGAPVPSGADAVVPVEKATLGSDSVTIDVAPSEGAHIRRRGEDTRAGDEVVAPGTVLGPWQLAAVASAGYGTVSVTRRPRVAVLATGDELVDPGSTPGAGQISDSNSTLLAALVRDYGGVPVVLPRAGDAPGAVSATLAGIDADLIVTAGGASVGAYDPVKADLIDRGVTFHAVAMQPGKPQGLGLVDGTPIACLPGNPVSVAATFAVVVAPMMRRLLGVATPRGYTARAGSTWRTPSGRAQYLPAVVDAGGAVHPATPRGSQSHLVASLARGRLLAVVPASVDEVHPGDTVGLMSMSLEGTP
ncbi:molybdopterin molybdotransferase MoeA [Demequina flava]|uniref:molybdopterin molybdotransferase MoeA n=1 Tax=Demequina flava TaxID=1095025 RepID=UPI0007851D39|nr:gephyrin-like molybdotransferase Glp [Demequina flava]